MTRPMVQPEKRGDRVLVGIRVVLFVGIVLGTGSIGWSAELQEGKWDGTYTLHSGERLEVRYLVRTPEEDPKHYHIKMIILDAEPEITYNLKKIVLKKKKLAFTMGSESETSTCQLKKQENEQYIGSCQSSLDPEGTMLADISMIPPDTEE